VKSTSTLLASLACIGFALAACTTTYTESDQADEPLDAPAVEVPNCSTLADEFGCEAERPFDPDDNEY